ncbi:MAG: VWA domain-containing protein [Thermoguttaceae bacterium]|nr:VWA domain-containing protein [Thermoguttaceae bacterium]
MRRLPVYLLIDVSGSMSGEPIESVKNGMQTLHSALRRDPYALESAYVSVITFSSDVQQIVPLTEVAMFQPPQISAGGGTSLGAALKKVTECAEVEVQKTTADEKGDWKPLVFILTDGVPTDDVTKGLEIFRQYKWGTVVACAAGDAADVQELQKITECVIHLDVTDQGAISEYFKWVSASIASSSKKVDSGGDVGGMDELPPPPPEITLVKP